MQIDKKHQAKATDTEYIDSASIPRSIRILNYSQL